MPAITEFCNKDRALLEEIKYHLETIARHMEKSTQPAAKWYEISDGAIINLRVVQALNKAHHTPDIYFYVGGYNEGEMTYIKKFETTEACDAEFERLKKMLQEARDE